MMRTTSTAIALLLTAAPAIAQASWTYSDIDQDGNLELSSAEFQALGEELFVSWDADTDQLIGEQEFYSGVYDAWDTDADGILTEAEYAEGWDTWFGDIDQPAFSDLDSDGNSELTDDELMTVLGDAGVYGDWSADGELGQEQFTTGLYDVYDTDDDMAVTQTEYDDVGPFWTDGQDGEGMQGTEEMLGAEVISLAEWTYEDLYADGVSAEGLIDELEVYGQTGEEIGNVEDFVIGPDGEILSMVVQVGGFWDIGDTHVSIPFGQVEFTGDGVVVPVTEDTVGDYGFEQEMFTAEAAASELVTGVDDANVARAWRANELIGDYVRLREGDVPMNYGYVTDLILRDGQLAAVVTERSFQRGGGYYAYPYYGFGGGYGVGAEAPYYDLPYGEGEVGGMTEFEYDRLGT